jgi:hypothetical protein
MDPVLAKFISEMTFLIGCFSLAALWIYMGLRH